MRLLLQSAVVKMSATHIHGTTQHAGRRLLPSSRPEVEPACRWCGEGQETISHISQECPQLTLEGADAGVSNPRDLWNAPAMAMRFAGAIEPIPGLD